MSRLSKYTLPSSHWMNSSTILEQAWRTAVPKIVSICTSLSSQETPKQRVVRVGQLDAELLDQELVQILKEPILKALSLVSVRSVPNILTLEMTDSFSIPSKLVLSRNSVYSYKFSFTNCRYGTMGEATVRSCKTSDMSCLELPINLSLVRVHIRFSSVTSPSSQHPGCHA